MIFDRVLETISKNNLIEDNDSIIVAVSGGPDSICLLHILSRISKERNLKLYVAHLNHQIRGLDAYIDALYVMKFCEKLEIPCFIRSIDVPAYCEEHKLGTEDGARILRYELFNEIKKKVGANKVAIGHNKNDQAETVLMRIMRGTGLQGLKGIEYRREDGVIRPILDLSREEIERYCQDNELNPRIDGSNLEPIYSRNKIRLELLPYMKKEFNENIVDTVVRMSRSLKIDGEYISNQVEKEFNRLVKKYSDGTYIFMQDFESIHEAIKSRIVFRAIKETLGNTNSIDKKHILEILDLEKNDKIGKMINLPRGIFAYRKQDYILITKNEIIDESIEYDYEITIGEEIFIPELNKTFKSRIVNKEDFDKNFLKKGIQYVDLGKIKDKLRLRNRRQGDKIRLLGGTKKIKELFIGLKIPKEERNLVPLLIEGDDVVAVCGYRINVNYKVNDYSGKILEFTLE